MNTEQNQKALLEQLEALKKENEQLKKELSILRNENISNRPVSFKEKYAVRILDSLPDMLTVFNQNEVGIEVVSNEETNHVGISNKDFKGMYMREMVPPEAYHPSCHDNNDLHNCNYNLLRCYNPGSYISRLNSRLREIIVVQWQVVRRL